MVRFQPRAGSPLAGHAGRQVTEVEWDEDSGLVLATLDNNEEFWIFPDEVKEG